MAICSDFPHLPKIAKIDFQCPKIIYVPKSPHTGIVCFLAICSDFPHLSKIAKIDFQCPKIIYVEKYPHTGIVFFWPYVVIYHTFRFNVQKFLCLHYRDFFFAIMQWFPTLSICSLNRIEGQIKRQLVKDRAGNFFLFFSKRCSQFYSQLFLTSLLLLHFQKKTRDLRFQTLNRIRYLRGDPINF